MLITPHTTEIFSQVRKTHSAVRQHLYKELKERGLLSASDDVVLASRDVCLVVQTEVSDSEEFPDLQLEKNQFLSVMGTVSAT